jgi:hypothetical protein
MNKVLDRVRAAGFIAISRWVLEQNVRACRFYERAGFVLTAQSQILDSLGAVTEPQARSTRTVLLRHAAGYPSCPSCPSRPLPVMSRR